MDKVVIIARVSTDKQEYQRQLVELREHCNRVGWEIVNEFPTRSAERQKSKIGKKFWDW